MSMFHVLLLNEKIKWVWAIWGRGLIPYKSTKSKCLLGYSSSTALGPLKINVNDTMIQIFIQGDAFSDTTVISGSPV